MSLLFFSLEHIQSECETFFFIKDTNYLYFAKSSHQFLVLIWLDLPALTIVSYSLLENVSTWLSWYYAPPVVLVFWLLLLSLLCWFLLISRINEHWHFQALLLVSIFYPLPIGPHGPKGFRYSAYDENTFNSSCQASSQNVLVPNVCLPHFSVNRHCPQPVSRG